MRYIWNRDFSHILVVSEFEYSEQVRVSSWIPQLVEVYFVECCSYGTYLAE